MTQNSLTVYVRLASCRQQAKYSKKVILKIVRKHIGEKALPNASQLGFRAHHSTTLQCMRLKDHVILNFNNKIPTAAVFLDIEEAFDITWHFGLLYTLSKLEFSTTLIKLISFFLSQCEFSVSVEGEMSTLRQGKYEQGCLKVLSCPQLCTCL
jgi:hypothetical protein